MALYKFNPFLSMKFNTFLLLILSGGGGVAKCPLFSQAKNHLVC